jgi:hypothetical protein
MRDFKFFQRERVFTDWMDRLDDYHLGGITNDNVIRWRSANGDVTCIHDMSTQHVRNIIRCLAGNGTMRIPIYYEGRFRREWFEIFRNELERRSEQI